MFSSKIYIQKIHNIEDNNVEKDKLMEENKKNIEENKKSMEERMTQVRHLEVYQFFHDFIFEMITYCTPKFVIILCI